MKKVLLTATVQSHICQFHKPLVKVLHELGHEVHVAARNNLAEKNGLMLDFVDKVYDIPFARVPWNRSNIYAYKLLKEIVQKEEYDIIHCNTPVGGILTRLAAIKERKKGCKILYTAHGFHFYKGAPVKNWLIYYPIEKLFSRVTDVLITINKEDYELAKSKFKTHVEYIHGVGVDADRYKPVSDNDKKLLRKKMGYEDFENIILCIGELLPNKNQIMAIYMLKEVLKSCPKTILLIAGNGPEKENLENQVKNLVLCENVKFLGYCTNLEKYQEIADVLVACSKREGLGLNIIEALLSGNPVVATRNRGHIELIHDYKNGYLVEQDNSHEMANRVTEILMDKYRLHSLRKEARKSGFVYAYEIVEQELEKIYINSWR